MSQGLTRILEQLVSALSERDASRTKMLLEDLRTEDLSFFERLNDFVLKAATSGTIGNAAYDWLKVLWPILPK